MVVHGKKKENVEIFCQQCSVKKVDNQRLLHLKKHVLILSQIKAFGQSAHSETDAETIRNQSDKSYFSDMECPGFCSNNPLSMA